MTTRLHILTPLILILQGCAPPPPWIETQPQWVQEFALESGAPIPRDGVPQDGNFVLGKVLYDNEEVKGPLSIAMVIIEDDGDKTLDYFSGIEISSESVDVFGPGNFKTEVYKLAQAIFDDTPSERRATEYPYLDKLLAERSTFATHFSELLDESFELTFKKFEGNSFYLKNAPTGYAYVWARTPVKRQPITHIPTRIRLEPVQGSVTRMEINTSRAYSYAHL